MARDGEDCPMGNVVATEGECKKAASLLGMNYEGNKSSTSYPAGCGASWFHSKVYFNALINPKKQGIGHAKECVPDMKVQILYLAVLL